MTAKEIAAQIIADLKSGRLQKVGIDEIRDAIKKAGIELNDRLEEQVVRAVVFSAA